VLIVKFTTSQGKPSEKQVPITSALTFEDVLKSIAKSKVRPARCVCCALSPLTSVLQADEYEIVSEQGLLLAGSVAHYFEGKSEAVVTMQKSDVDL
jgi:hypothetical protein